jgi:hypothetical protein
MPVDRKPITAVGIKPDATTFNLNAQIPEIRVAD